MLHFEPGKHGLSTFFLQLITALKTTFNGGGEGLSHSRQLAIIAQVYIILLTFG